MENTKKRISIVKIILIIILSLLGLLILVVGGYVIYMQATYYRIDDFAKMEINNPIETQINKNQKYSITTYNIGFGAYEQDYTFFMDVGEMKDGTVTQGHYARAFSKEDTIKNVNGSIELLKSINADFMFLQEVDVDATRSYYVNECEMISDEFNSYSNIYSSNFHSGYLAYPFYQMHGKVEAGTLTLSKYNVREAVRRQLPISTDFFTKFFDLDRCFTINYVPVKDGKELALINLHLSAYDEGGVFRALQMELLNEVMLEEYNKGNYVIAGGDFNHDIADSATYFKTEQKIPSWLSFLDDEDLNEGFSFADANNNAPTCRGADIVYQRDVTYTCVVDGFIVSDNVLVNKVENIDNDFKYSDHNPAYMEFTLL